MSNEESKRNAILGGKLVSTLEKLGYAAYYCATKEEALAKALELIPETDVVSWGGSASIEEIGLKAAIKARNKYIDRDEAPTLAENMERRRQGLLADTYLMSTKALALQGELVNIDGTGNRVAALCFGPKQMVLVVGMNKVAPDLHTAIARARNTAAPINVQRFPARKTPCQQNGSCANCTSPDTICNHIVVTRRSAPVGRIKIILVGENLGF